MRALFATSAEVVQPRESVAVPDRTIVVTVVPVTLTACAASFTKDTDEDGVALIILPALRLLVVAEPRTAEVTLPGRFTSEVAVADASTRLFLGDLIAATVEAHATAIVLRTDFASVTLLEQATVIACPITAGPDELGVCPSASVPSASKPSIRKEFQARPFSVRPAF